MFESSGLVDTGGVVYTINDSGDDAVVYGVDPRTGAAGQPDDVRRTRSTDVEAIAPGRDGTRVGRRHRRQPAATATTCTVYRVDPRDGEHPGTRAPADLPRRRARRGDAAGPPADRPGVRGVQVALRRHRVRRPARPCPATATDRLHAFARVPGLVTDGTFFPDGKHVLLRTYGTASVYTFPGFALVGTVRLPAQQQGEGISVSPQGRVLVSSEGPRADVLAGAAAGGARPTRRPPRRRHRWGPDRPRDPQRPGDRPPRDRTAEEWGWIALASVGVLSLGYLALRAVRRRGRRRR